LLFKENCYHQIKRENPDATVFDINKIIAKNWGSLDKQTHGYYAFRHLEFLEVYYQEMALYEAACGKIQPRGGIFG